jgi:NADPH2:quinone reductase
MLMKHTRIIVTHYGGPDALQVLEEERPEPKNGEARVKVLAAGVAMPDIMAREGVHPETPRVPFTPGWDLVGVVDGLGDGVSGTEPGQVVAAMPIHGAYAEFVCLSQPELVPVPAGLDAAEAVSLILNYITAYQMLHRSAMRNRSGRRAEAKGKDFSPCCAGLPMEIQVVGLRALRNSAVQLLRRKEAGCKEG